MTRRLLAANSSVGQGWTARDPRDPAGPARIGLDWIRSHAHQIFEMTDNAIRSGDNGDQLRALAESNRLAYKIKADAHRAFRAASGGIARLEDSSGASERV